MSEQNMPEKYTVNFLDDDTTDEDAFGGHQRIADTLRGIISTTKKGKSIALLGDYGSGKSSVIKMMAKGLPEDIKVFTYDAWAHQGDHLRRSFLERLMECMEDKGWCEKDEEILSEIRAKFQGTTSVTQTMPEYRLTKLSWIVLLWTLLLPVGYKLLGNNAIFGFFQDMGFAFTHTHLGILIIAFPLLVIFLEWLANRCNAFGGSGENKGDKERRSKSLIYLLINKGVEETTSITNAQPDPSSVDFENDYKGILQHVLVGKPGRKLVLVIDNLDRVDVQEARAIWATMQTFCNIGCNGNNEEWHKRVWLIAPIAHASALRLWGTDENAQGIQFIEKTFQLVFKVPPPMVADWKRYFLDMLKDALPGLEQVLYDEIFTIYSMPHTVVPGNLAGQGFYAHSTPRNIKDFLNKLCSLVSAWQREIPLNIMALYLRGVDGLKIGEFEQRIIHRNWPYLNKQEDSKNAYLNLAMIHFAKENREEASDILAMKAIQEYLFSDTPKNLLEHTSSRAFTEYVVHHTLFQLAQNSFTRYRDICNIASVDRDKPLGTNARRIIFEAFFDHIIKRDGLYSSIDKENIKYIEDETSKGVIALLDYFLDNNRTAAIQLVAILGCTPASIDNDVMLHTWLKEIIGIVTWFFHREGGKRILRENFAIAASAEVYLKCLSYMGDNSIGEQYEQYFKTTAKEADVLQALSKLFELKKASQNQSSPQLSESHVEMLIILMRIYPDWDYKYFISNMPFGLKSSEIEHNSSFVCCLDILLFMYSKSLKYWKQEWLTNTAKDFKNLPSYIGFEKDDDDRSVLIIFLLICFPYFNQCAFNAHVYKFQQAFNRTAYDEWWPTVLLLMIIYFNGRTLSELIECQNRNTGIKIHDVTTDEVIMHLIRLLSEKDDAHKYGEAVPEKDRTWLKGFLDDEQYDSFFGDPIRARPS